MEIVNKNCNKTFLKFFFCKLPIKNPQVTKL